MSDFPRTWRLAHHLGLTSPVSLTDQIALLRDCYRAEAAQGPLRALAMVVLPQSVHAVWQLAPTDNPMTRWTRFTRSFQSHAGSDCSWQAPWVAPVLDGDTGWTVSDIHAQPVAWKLAKRAEDWPYSSIHRAKVAA